MDGWTDGQTYGCTDIGNFSLFYRSLSPIGPLPKEEQGKGTSNHLMPLGDCLVFPCIDLFVG